jgi:hypothetical protein
MSKSRNIVLGFEIGDPNTPVVEIPLKHMAVTGQTQEAGKTTALEGLIARAGLKAVTFITKRGEASFVGARRIDPYFREQADWQFVASILEASRGEKLKFERAWIIRASKGASTLADVQRNVRKAMETAKGMSADVYLTLDAYLDVVVPEIAKIKWAPGVDLRDGVNVIDMTGLSIEMQHLVIRSTLRWVLNREKNTVVVVPEAWKFIPQGRGTPVKLAAEEFIRQAAAMGNYLWLDSQDLGGIEKQILRSVPVWILGVQRETNEIKRTLDNIPAGFTKPKPADIATLELGQFYACWGRHAVKTYAQPAWLSNREAMQVAAGEVPIEAIRSIEPERLTREIVTRPNLSPPPHIRIEPKPPQPERPKAMSFDEQLAAAHREADALRDEIKSAMKKLGGIVDDKWDDAALIAQFRETISATVNAGRQTAPATGNGKVQAGPMHIEAIEREVSITFSQEERTFKTTGPKGMIMFALVHDLKNQPSGESEISEAMRERGWDYPHNTLAPELGKLTKDGDLIKEGATRGVRYRVPGKLILSIDGKKITP